jgi:hypothetical protein
MLNKIKWKIFIINIFIDILIVIFLNIQSKMVIHNGLLLSLSMFGLGIFCSLFFGLFLYLIYQFSELKFKFFTILFLLGSFFGIITICVNLIRDELIFLSITIPLINIFFLCLYVGIYIWKIDRNKYIENKMENKIKKDNNKIIV